MTLHHVRKVATAILGTVGETATKRGGCKFASERLVTNKFIGHEAC
jgi:hypothetical protein